MTCDMLYALISRFMGKCQGRTITILVHSLEYTFENATYILFCCDAQNTTETCFYLCQFLSSVAHL